MPEPKPRTLAASAAPRAARAIAALVLLLPFSLLAGSSGEKWVLVGTKDDIITYQREVAGSPVVAIRGEGTVDASIARVASVLLDTTRLVQWIGSLTEAHRLRSAGKLSYTEYDHVSVPFPLTDREFVTQSSTELDATNKQVVVRAHSVQDPAAPVTKLVRGDLLSSTFTLVALDHGRRTRVIAEAHADPKGAIPKWIVNYFQKSWAHATIMGLRSQVRKADVPDDPELETMLEQAGFFQ
jgi:hypothetical protein